MSETLEELKAIVAFAPFEQTMVCSNGHYWNDEGLATLAISGDSINGVLRSLADIKRIIELMEDNNKLRQATIKEVLNKKVSMTSTGREVWIRVQDVEDMLDE